MERRLVLQFSDEVFGKKTISNCFIIDFHYNFIVFVFCMPKSYF